MVGKSLSINRSPEGTTATIRIPPCTTLWTIYGAVLASSIPFRSAIPGGAGWRLLAREPLYFHRIRTGEAPARVVVKAERPGWDIVAINPQEFSADALVARRGAFLAFLGDGLQIVPHLSLLFWMFGEPLWQRISFKENDGFVLLNHPGALTALQITPYTPQVVEESAVIAFTPNISFRLKPTLWLSGHGFLSLLASARTGPGLVVVRG